MPCPNNIKDCPQKKVKNKVISQGLDFTTRLPVQSYVINHKAEKVSIIEPVVTTRNLPTNWGLTVKVNDVNIEVTGNTPQEVVKNIVSVYEENGIDIDLLAVWYNANIEWSKKVGINSLRTTTKNLLAIAKHEGANTVVIDGADIENQGVKFWGMLQAYLTIHEDEFNVDDFFAIINVIKHWLNAKIGCPRCYNHLLNSMPPSDVNRHDARLWVFHQMNTIRKANSKPEYSWEQAIKTNLWN